MNFFFDNCFPRRLAEFLADLAAHDQEAGKYEHMHHVPEWRRGDAPDDEWIAGIEKRDGAWTIVTVDKGGKAGRAAWQACRRPVLRLHEDWADMRLRQQSQFILNVWDRVALWARDHACPGPWRVRSDFSFEDPTGKALRMKPPK